MFILKGFVSRLASIPPKSFFTKKQRLSNSTKNLLVSVYPTINWARVDLYEGLPWFTKIFTPSKGAGNA